MSRSKAKNELKNKMYEADLMGLQSLRLIAAPNPKDDLTDEELAAFCRDPKRSPELIRHLIDFVKQI
jgi:hypothetical protein